MYWRGPPAAPPTAAPPPPSKPAVAALRLVAAVPGSLHSCEGCRERLTTLSLSLLLPPATGYRSRPPPQPVPVPHARRGMRQPTVTARFCCRQGCRCTVAGCRRCCCSRRARPPAGTPANCPPTAPRHCRSPPRPSPPPCAAISCVVLRLAAAYNIAAHASDGPGVVRRLCRRQHPARCRRQRAADAPACYAHTLCHCAGCRVHQIACAPGCRRRPCMHAAREQAHNTRRMLPQPHCTALPPAPNRTYQFASCRADGCASMAALLCK